MTIDVLIRVPSGPLAGIFARGPLTVYERAGGGDPCVVLDRYIYRGPRVKIARLRRHGDYWIAVDESVRESAFEALWRPQGREAYELDGDGLVRYAVVEKHA